MQTSDMSDMCQERMLGKNNNRRIRSSWLQG